jgi:ferredoxin-nitrate reductase
MNRIELDILGETICPYCGVGCRLQLEGREGKIIRTRGVTDAPANHGRLCAKGALVHETLTTADRLTVALARRHRHEDFRVVSWDAAWQQMVETLGRIRRSYGPDAIAFYGSGQLDSETAYLVGKLFKGTLGTNNTDSNSRLCMASAVAGYRTSLGSDGPPCCYDDIDHCDVALIIGSNMAEAHPVLWDRLQESRKHRRLPFVIVVDPRRTLTAREADLFIRVAPGGDIALLNALGRLMVESGWVNDRFVVAHTRGFDQYLYFLLGQNLDELCRAAGVSRDELQQVAARLGMAQAWLSFYCMGLNQSTVGVWKNNSLINLHLLTGQIGKPGAGPFSLTGQPNAMGGRETGLLSHQLPGYRFVDNEEHRREVERYWQRPVGTIADKPGLTAVEMFRALERGQLKAIWIAGTNPLVSLPDLHQVRRAMAKALFVVVQDAYHPTETTELAHIVLPAAQFTEKEWTSTNSERLVSYSPKLREAPGEALPDWQIIARFAQTAGFPGFDYSSAAQVWDEFRGLTTGRPCDMTGITAARLRRDRHVYWPCPRDDHPGEPRRYLDRQFPTSDGKAVFLPRDHREPRELPDHEFPFVLTTGRLYTHWHTLTRTGQCPKLVRREPGPFVEIHPRDAARLGIEHGELVQISSRRGTIRVPARVSEVATPGMVFLPFHWGDRFTPENAANYLTISATGRLAKQPELKFCAVHLERISTDCVDDSSAFLTEWNLTGTHHATT